MVPWRFSRNEISRRPGRALLTLLSVVIGVATLLAVSISIATTRRAFREMYQTLAGKAALEVRADGGGGFNADVLDLLDAAPGVRAAVPVLQRQSILYFESHRIEIMVLGIDTERDTRARDYFFEEGGSFPEGAEVLLEARFAEGLGIQLGDQVKLPKARGRQSFTVAGLLAPRGAGAFPGGGIIFMPLAEAQSLFRARGRLNTVYLVLDDGVPEDRVVEELSDQLPEGLSVGPPAARTEMARETLLSTEQGLSMAGALSMVAAAFIIVNSFFMNLTERRRQLATLRAIGAMRWQIVALVVREGLLLGLLGTALGILVGIGGAFLLTRGMERIFQTALPSFEVPLGPVLRVLVIGPALSLAAVLLPAWAATRISPLEGMRPAIAGASDGRRAWSLWVGLGLMAIASYASVLLYQGILPPPTTPWVIATALVGMSLTLPATIAPGLRVLGPLLERSSVNGLLACRQILRQRSRSGLTAGVLFVVVVMGVGMGNSVLNNIQDVRNWVRRTMQGDFLVRGALMFDPKTGECPPLPDGILEEVRAVPGITFVDPWSFATTKADGQTVMVVARAFDPGGPLSLDLQEGDPESVRRLLHDGQAVVSTVLARRLDIGAGDEITLATKQGKRQLRIAATVNDYIMGGTMIYLQSAVAEKLLGLSEIHALGVRAAPGSKAEVESALRKICQARGVLLNSVADFAREIDNLMSGVVAAMWGLLAAGFIVAAFGVVNTLTMNVMEQTRELGLLRVVGMSRGQARLYVLNQAAVIGLVAIPAGTIVGELIAYIINRVSGPLLGHPIAFGVQPLALVGCAVFGFLITIVSALLPAERAARLEIGQAVQNE